MLWKNCKLIIFWFATRKKSRHPSMASFIIDTLNSTCLINKACLFTQRRQTPQFYPQRLPPWPPAAAVYSTAITQSSQQHKKWHHYPHQELSKHRGNSLSEATQSQVTVSRVQGFAWQWLCSFWTLPTGWWRSILNIHLLSLQQVFPHLTKWSKLECKGCFYRESETQRMTGCGASCIPSHLGCASHQQCDSQQVTSPLCAWLCLFIKMR